jgi:hypothetical protein
MLFGGCIQYLPVIDPRLQTLLPNPHLRALTYLDDP